MHPTRQLVLILAFAAFGVAAAPLLSSPPDLCFTSGSVTYRLTSDAAAADYRVAIDNAAVRPDLRVRLVDRVEVADFALTDDAASGRACRAAGVIKTVVTVPAGTPADITIAVAHKDARTGDAEVALALFVHSARVGHFDAAALLALIRRETARDGGRLAAIR
jgi:hypothetical protein